MHLLLLRASSSLPEGLFLAFLSLPVRPGPLGLMGSGKDCRVEDDRLVNFNRKLEDKGEPVFAWLNQISCFPTSLLLLFFS